ncbi:hypothetical protein V6U81_08715 [Micromonospora sp. CPCC 205711]|uniref:hypothetical protein n=1 Tax=Micromonospora sp. CPCC 205547 TaxID=3122400 RepID=UPI002FF36FB5
MEPDDTSLRDDLDAVAAQAGPLRLDPTQVIGRVRRRRRRRTLLGATAGTALTLLTVTAVTAVVGGGGRPGPTTAGGPQVEPSILGPSPTGSAAPTPSVFECGRRLTLTDAPSSRSGLTMTVGPTRFRAAGLGPALTVTFTASAATQVVSSPPTLFQVLYLRDGTIVGGGPMLNVPGDPTPQGIDAVGYGFPVAPDRPARFDLGPRDRLCPSLSWQQVWSAPSAYEVVVLQGPVERGPEQTTLGIPALDGPLLASRVGLSR